MSGCGLATLSGLPSGDLVHQRADLRSHLTLFSASSQICSPAEIQTFDPMCFCNLCSTQPVCHVVFLFHATETFSLCQSPQGKIPLSEHKIMYLLYTCIYLTGHLCLTICLIFDSPYCQTSLIIKHLFSLDHLCLWACTEAPSPSKLHPYSLKDIL